MGLVSFKTKQGKVSFHTRPAGSRKRSRGLNAFAKEVKATARDTGLSGPKLFKEASKRYRSKSRSRSKSPARKVKSRSRSRSRSVPRSQKDCSVRKSFRRSHSRRLPHSRSKIHIKGECVKKRSKSRSRSRSRK